MPASVIQDFFESRGFQAWLRNREGEHKTQAAIVGRLDNLTRAVGELAKVLSNR